MFSYGRATYTYPFNSINDSSALSYTMDIRHDFHNERNRRYNGKDGHFYMDCEDIGFRLSK